MKKNKRLEERRKRIPEDVNIFVKQSFDIADRVLEILDKQGKEQKDLAKALGKNESEISKWLTGTHNFTIKTISKIEAALGEKVIGITKANKETNKTIVIWANATYSMQASMHQSNYHTQSNARVTPSSNYALEELNYYGTNEKRISRTFAPFNCGANFLKTLSKISHFT